MREYWIVDPDREEIELLRLERDRFAPGVVLRRVDGDRVESTVLPGLELPLAEVFA